MNKIRTGVSRARIRHQRPGQTVLHRRIYCLMADCPIEERCHHGHVRFIGRLINKFN